MPPPHCAVAFASRVYAEVSPEGTFSLPEELANLPAQARGSYAWPASETPAVSQQKIAHLENETLARIERLDAEEAHWIVQQVSIWGGNNVRAQRAIDSYSRTQRLTLHETVASLLARGSVKSALRTLSEQPGIGLVMATKVYRFCCPSEGAALDRHSSYFFNSLPLREVGMPITRCAHFKRQWSTGKRRTSRLAAYTDSGLAFNLEEYMAVYLPRLAAIANCLNRRGTKYVCGASSKQKEWRPADVEMAAYQWWSRNGPK